MDRCSPASQGSDIEANEWMHEFSARKTRFEEVKI